MKAYKLLESNEIIEVEIPARNLAPAAARCQTFLAGYYQACWEHAHLGPDQHYYLGHQSLTEALNQGPWEVQGG